MNLKDAQNKLSADISQLYETYQLISKNKHQFNELDVALLQQQLLYIYHSLLKVQGHLAQHPVLTTNVEEVLPLVGLKPEPEELSQPEVITAEIPVETPVIPAKEEELPVSEPIIPVAPPVEEAPKQILTFDFNTPANEPEPTLDELEQLMREQEEAEEANAAIVVEPTPEPQIQATLPLEPVPVKETPQTKDTQTEVSLLDKLSATLKTADVYEKITRESQQSLKQAINLNKKIAFVNNLFNENTVEYAKAIEKLNASTTLHEALRYFNELKHQYNWNNDNALVRELEQLIEKRYA